MTGFHDARYARSSAMAMPGPWKGTPHGVPGLLTGIADRRTVLDNSPFPFDMPREGFITRREAESTYKRSESQVRRDVWAAHDRKDFDFLSHFYVELADETIIDGRDATKEKMDEVKRQRPIWCVRETFMASAYWKRDKPKSRGVPEAEAFGGEQPAGAADGKDDYNDLPANIRRLLIEKDARLEDARRREAEARNDKEQQNGMFQAMLAEIIGVDKLKQLQAEWQSQGIPFGSVSAVAGSDEQTADTTDSEQGIGEQHGDEQIKGRHASPPELEDERGTGGGMETVWNKNRPLRDIVVGPARFLSAPFRRTQK